MSSPPCQFLWRFLCGEHLDGAGRAGSVIPCSGLRRGRNRVGVTRFLAAALKSGGRLDCGILRSMADRRRRLPENVAGDFFVDDTCIDCDACRAIAPATFHDHGAQSSVYRQPENPEARRQALKALVTCPTASIGTESDADHAAFAREFGCTRIMHAADGAARLGVELVVDGTAPVSVDADLVVIPTPGHTRGHLVLLYRDRFLFTGDHLAWSPEKQTLTAFRDVCWYSWPEQTRSMERLLAYRFEWVLPGHGHIQHSSAEAMQAHLQPCV